MNDTSTILIIDDEPALRLGLAAKIKRQGYNVLTAADGAEGLQKAGEALPDLILSDVMMPPPNGFELRQLMSMDEKLSSIPFIFLTARNSVNDRVNGIRDGADDYITKPFETEELFARIEAVLRRVKMAHALGREEMQAIARLDMERLKREVLQNFHHEMRTPLTNIIMPLELVINKKFDDPEEQAKFIRMALSNVDRLESLVTDFILMTNIDHGDLNDIRQSISMGDHILYPVNKKLERYKSKNIHFIPQFSLESEITAPRREFIHAVMHLVDNAMKFGVDGGTVKLMIESARDGSAVITVQDDGPGIPRELRKKVFERYYQIDQGDSRNYEGLGVGLSIARAVFEHLGGSLNILDSEIGCRVQALIPKSSMQGMFNG